MNPPPKGVHPLAWLWFEEQLADEDVTLTRVNFNVYLDEDLLGFASSSAT